MSPTTPQDAMDRFGELRSLLQQPPSPELWLALTSLIEAAPEPQARQLLVPYALDSLRRWPHELRTWQARWTRRVLRAIPLPVARLPSRCDLSNRQIDRTILPRLTAYEDVGPLRELRLSGNRHLGEALDEAVALPLLAGGQLRRLELEDCGLIRREVAERALHHEHLHALTALDLGSYQSGNDHLSVLAQCPAHLSLRWLGCGVHVHDHEWLALLDQPMPSLRALRLYMHQPEQQQRTLLHIERSPWWHQLEELDLGWMELPTLLLSRAWPTSLKRLRSARYLSALATLLPQLPKLAQLEVCDMRLGGDFPSWRPMLRHLSPQAVEHLRLANPVYAPFFDDAPNPRA